MTLLRPPRPPGHEDLPLHLLPRPRSFVENNRQLFKGEMLSCSGIFKDLLDLLLGKAVVDDSARGRMGGVHLFVGEEVQNHEHAGAGPEALNEAAGCEGRVVEVVEA